MTFDQETGEVKSNGTISERAAGAAAAARLQMNRDRNGYGAVRLQEALDIALQSIPHFIATDAKGHHAIKYASLQQILSVVRPPLLAVRVRIRQGAERSFSADEGGGNKTRMVPVYTDLMHTGSGEYERTTIEIPIFKMDAQSMGSAITYGRRYSLLAALGLATDDATDDDGQAAKPRELGSSDEESKTLVALTAELKKMSAVTELLAWKGEAKTRRAYNSLSPEEAAIFGSRYKDKESELIEAVSQ